MALLERMASYSSYLFPSYLNGLSFAQAGFIYTGVGDMVMCPRCRIYLQNWDKHQNPFKVHMAKSQLCPYVMFKTDPRVKKALSNGYDEDNVLSVYKRVCHYPMTTPEFIEQVEAFKNSSTPAAGEDFNCKVCLARPVGMVFLPCRHLCVCDRCAAHCKEICPICRGKSWVVMGVYI